MKPWEFWDMMHVGDFRKLIRGYRVRQEEKNAIYQMNWKVTRWAGWASIAASVGSRKAKKPETWFPLPGDKRTFDKKYIKELRKRMSKLKAFKNG